MTRVDTKAAKLILKLPENIRIRITKKLRKANSDPFRFYEALEGRKDYKLRIGDYRVIADICIKERLIKVKLAGHRKHIYNKI